MPQKREGRVKNSCGTNWSSH